MTVLSRKPGGSGGGGAPSGPAGGDLGGTYPNPDIAANAVGTTEIANGAVTAAKVAADVATQAELDAAAALLTPISGWVDDSAATWTRTADQTFTVTGDRTAVFTKGTRLRWTQTTVKYGTVILSSHAAGTTTVTIATTTDYVLTAAAISVNSYSLVANPSGYPVFFNYAPANETGWSTANPFSVAKFAVTGRICFVNIDATGTSDATTTTFDAPITSAQTADPETVAKIQNSGADAFGRMYFTSTTQLKFGVSASSDVWTASGTKGVQASFWYGI